MTSRIFLLSAVLIPFVICVALPDSETPLPASPAGPTHFEDTLEKTHGEIIFSSILFRHGDRNPVFSFPTDRYKEYSEKAAKGKLVKAGKQRAYRLGLWARARYAKLVLEVQNVTTPEVLSSDRNRAIESAQMFMAAFWQPQSEEEIWNATFPWQPIPIHTISWREDNFIALKARCHRVNWEINRAKESPLLNGFYADLGEEFFVHLENSTQVQIPRNDSILALVTICRIHDALLTQKHLGLELPTWAEKVYPNPLESLRDKEFKLYTYNEVTKRLKGGPLLERLIRSMINKRASADRKNESATDVFRIYSGHDMTLSVLLNTLGLDNVTFPEYSAAILVELRSKEGAHFVTILYRNSEDEAATHLIVPECGDPCSLEQFIQIFLPRTPSNWKKECNTFDPDYNAII